MVSYLPLLPCSLFQASDKEAAAAVSYAVTKPGAITGTMLFCRLQAMGWKKTRSVVAGTKVPASTLHPQPPP